MSPRLDTADAVYMGGTAADKVYRGSTLVWNSTPPPPVNPTTDYWFSFEGGTPGENVPLAAPTGVPFDDVPGLAYDNDAKNGLLGGTGFGGGEGRGQWNLPSPEFQHSVGFWYKAGNTATGAEARIMDFRSTATSGTVCGVLLTVAGNIRMMQGSSGVSVGQSPAIDRAKWYWIAYMVDMSTGGSIINISDENGDPWHDGFHTITPPYSECLTARFGRIFGTSSGAFAMDDIQYQPGEITSLPPWFDVVKPDASNTGHNPATLDGTLSGTQWMDTPDVVVENKTINGKVVVRADNVGFRNCVFTGGTSEHLLEFRNPGGFVEDSTFLPTDSTAYVYNAVRGHDFTARRNDISGVCDGFGVYNSDTSQEANVLIEGNWVHDLYFGPDPGQGDGISHNDGVQLHANGGVTVRHNNFEIFPMAGSTHGTGTSGFLCTDGASAPTQPNIHIESNWFSGECGALVNLAVNGTPTEVSLRGNVFDEDASTTTATVIANDTANLTVPGLPASTGPDTNNGNVDQDGNPVTISRWAP